MPWIFIGGAVLVLAGAAAVVFFMRRRSVDRRSMYASRRSQIEHKVRAARQRTLAPHSRSEKPADVRPGPAAPATFGLKEAMPTIRFEPSAYDPPPAAPPPPIVAPGVAAHSPWETTAVVPGPPPPPPPPAQTELAPPPPPPPSGADPFAEPFGALPLEMPPPPPPEAPWTPTPAAGSGSNWTPAAPPPPERPWTPGPPQFEPVMPLGAVEPEPMTIPPPPSVYESMPEPNQMVTTAGWSVVAPESKPSADVSPAPKPSKKERQGPNLTESWLLATASPDDEENQDETKPNMSRALAQYAILVVGLVMVLIGVIVMVANSH